MQSDKQLRSVWQRYWSEYDEDERHARQIRAVAAEYPLKRGLVVSYPDLLDAGLSEAALRREVDRTLGAGVEAFESFVRSLDLDDPWPRSFDVMILHVSELPGGFKPFDSSLLAHLNELVQIDVTLAAPPESISDLMEAAFVCTSGHTTRIHQPGRRRRDIGHCPECGDPVYLEERDSLFADIRRLRLSGEGFSDVAAILGGRRWHRLDLREGDSLTVNAVPRAEFSGDSTHGSVYLDILEMQVEDDLPF